MRKVDNSTSQDGADTTSITSAIENEVKKASGVKTKRTSIKRKMPNFSHESDDTVIEPLLQSEKEKTDNSKSAKFLLSKSKTDSGSERSDNVFTETKIEKCSPTSITPLSESIPYTSKIKDVSVPKVTAPIHNHMNTNVFGGLEVTKTVPTKSAVIVEIEKSKGSTYPPGPLIFTTAKIHTDNKTKQMEPVQITPVPILSTIEGSVVKSVPRVGSGESRHESIKTKSEVQRRELQENGQKPIKPAVSTGISDSADCRQGLMKQESNVQRKEYQENVQKPIKPACSAKTSLTLGTIGTETQTNLKTTVTSGKEKIAMSPTTTTVVAPKPSQSLMDKSPLPKDTKIPTTVSKVDILSETSTSTSDTKVLKQDDILGTVADKTKKTVPEKSSSRFSLFEPTSEQETKIGNGKTPVLSGDSKKLSPTGVSSVKSEVSLTKDSVVVTSGSVESENKETSIRTVSSLSTNKQLQRQKKATVEDISDPDMNVKNIDRGKADNIALKDQGSKISASVKTTTESKTKSSVLIQSIPKTIVDTRSIVTTTSEKPITTIAEKSNIVTSVPTTLPNIAKASFTASKSEKDHSKDVTKSIGASFKSANTIKSVKKETMPDVKKGIENQTVSSQSAKLQETAQSAKMSSVSKSDSRVGSQIKDPEKSTLSSVASCVSSNGASTGKQPGLTTQALGAGKSSISSSVKSTVSTTLPSSTSSAKALITSNKKIDPIFSERNKDSRA